MHDSHDDHQEGQPAEATETSKALETWFDNFALDTSDDAAWVFQR